MQALRKSWFKADTLLSTKRPLPDQAEDAVSHAVMISRVLESNYLKAEALLQSTESKPDLIQLIRTKISRGQMEEAHALVIKALEITQEDSSFKNDLQLELCRVFYRTGEWTQSIEVANVLLNRDTLPSVGRLAALQTRSLCWFELGNWDRALRDIEDSRSLKMLYEQSQCCLYTEVLKIKTLARKNGVEGTLPLLSELWKKTANGEIPGNADTLLTLLRLEIDLKRIDNKDFSQEALACFHTAHAMGDDLYEALSILDLAYSTPSPLQRESRKRLFSLREKFRKIESNFIKTRFL